MRIDRLTITNFKGFEQREFSFHPRFNLLVGDNASGKSSVLEALRIGAGSWFLGIRGLQKSPGIEPAQVRVAAYPHQDSYSFEKQFVSRIECSGVVIGKTITWARELQREGGRTNVSDAKTISEAAREAEKGVRAGDELTLPLICIYGTERLVYETGHHRDRVKNGASRLPSRFDGYRDCLDFAIQETELLDWIRDQATASLPAKEDTIAAGVVKRAITSCVEGATSVYYDGRYKDLVVLLGPGPQLFKNLSDGQRIMLTFVGDLARRAALLNPHLANAVLRETPGIVMIDELDQHLHPKWQRRVIHDLKSTFPSVQFVATTHSPQLLGEVEEEEITILEDGEAARPAHSFGLDSNRVLEELMGASKRNPSVEELLTKLFKAIDEEDFDSARRLIEIVDRRTPDLPEVTKARALMTFLESPV